MTKVNAPCARGKVGHKGSRQYVCVPINGARRSRRRDASQLPPAEKPSVLSAHSVGLASGIRVQRTAARHVLYASASHALGMHDRHVQCPCGIGTHATIPCQGREKWERETEGQRETDCKCRRPGGRELSRHVPRWHFVLSRSAN